jgi:hypothetical protein
MIKSQIGNNAGKVWHFLDKNRESTFFEIKTALSIQSADLWMALGWLARENKIFFFIEEDADRITLLYN